MYKYVPYVYLYVSLFANIYIYKCPFDFAQTSKRGSKNSVQRNNVEIYEIYSFISDFSQIDETKAYLEEKNMFLLMRRK